MPLPETIPVKYTEEEAGAISMRPVVRQTFRAPELVDMIVGVTGKDPHRIRQILRSGTVVFHSYRYWWQGFEADPAALDEILARYPDADPSRAFQLEDCAEVIFESGNPAPRSLLRIRREDAGRKRLLRTRSFWDSLMALARSSPPIYREYSYSSRGDVYVLNLSADERARLAEDAARLAPRSLRASLAALPAAAHLAFLCPRHLSN
ncbi:MAG TPA: hypothetical protein VEU52_05790 [Candidatus Limnocylindrales bacterium]|nr:hypothetical protein [Candidatus Limnocylindrales bacterium]